MRQFITKFRLIKNVLVSPENNNKSDALMATGSLESNTVSMRAARALEALTPDAQDKSPGLLSVILYQLPQETIRIHINIFVIKM